MAVFWVDDGLALDPEEIELPDDEEPDEERPDDEVEPIGPVRVEDEPAELPPPEEELPKDDPLEDPPLPVESCAKAGKAIDPVAAISTESAKSFLRGLDVMAVSPISCRSNVATEGRDEIRLCLGCR